MADKAVLNPDKIIIKNKRSFNLNINYLSAPPDLVQNETFSDLN